MHDAADHATVVNARFAASISRKMSLEPGELPVVQPEMIANHRWSPFGDRESQISPQQNRFLGVLSVTNVL